MGNSRGPEEEISLEEDEITAKLTELKGGNMYNSDGWIVSLQTGCSGSLSRHPRLRSGWNSGLIWRMKVQPVRRSLTKHLIEIGSLARKNGMSAQLTFVWRQFCFREIGQSPKKTVEAVSKFILCLRLSYHLTHVDQVQVKNKQNIFHLITVIKSRRLVCETSFASDHFYIHFNTADKKRD